MVGLTPTELESLNELIHIDHFYVKSQSPSPKPELNSVPDSHKDIHNLEDFSVQVQEQPHQVAHVEISSTVDDPMAQFTCQEEEASEIPSEFVTQCAEFVTQCDIPNSVVSFVDSVLVKPEPIDTYSENFVESNSTDELMNALTDADLEASWSVNFLDQLDFDHSDLQGDSLIDEAEKSLAYFESMHKSKHENIVTEHDTAKYIDFGHFLSETDSTKEPISPLSISQSSDSDFYSDGIASEVFSPVNSEISLLDDLPWQDNFSELFPDLQ